MFDLLGNGVPSSRICTEISSSGTAATLTGVQVSGSIIKTTSMSAVTHAISIL